MTGGTWPASGGGAARPAQASQVAVWDAPTRLYHWVQLALVCGAYYTQWLMGPSVDPTMRWHRWCGYGVLVLLVFRLLWGFAGSPTARFASFIPSPRAVLRYAGQLVSGRAPRFLGHNPVGALMVSALLLLLAAQALSGLFTADSNGIFGGPFGHFDMMEESPAWKARLQRWHHMGANALLALIAIHVLVNLFYQFVRRDRLVTAMVTGVKPAGDYADHSHVAAQIPARVVTFRAILCLVTALIVVFGGLLLGGGKL